MQIRAQSNKPQWDPKQKINTMTQTIETTERHTSQLRKKCVEWARAEREVAAQARATKQQNMTLSADGKQLIDQKKELKASGLKVNADKIIPSVCGQVEQSLAKKFFTGNVFRGDLDVGKENIANLRSLDTRLEQRIQAEKADIDGMLAKIELELKFVDELCQTFGLPL